MRRITQAILLTCISIVTINGHAQNEIKLDVPRIVPISPTAAAMEKYQSYPVDYCTGIPNITIPLYEIVAGEITIPVTLTYHASGIKPKERSGMAGAGWTLNLEPSVSRQINGTVDEASYGWFNRNYSQNAIPIDEAAKLKYYGEIVDNIRDTHPDKFTYKLPNGGGSGYFLERFYPLRTIPRNNDKVEYSGGNIDITDENGVIYNFHGPYETVQGSYPTGDYRTRWMCSSIRSPRNRDNVWISFQYQTIPNMMNPSSFYNLDNKLIFNDCTNPAKIRTVLTEQKLNTTNNYRITPIYSPSTSSPYETKLEWISQSEAGVSYPSISRFVSGYMSNARLTGASFMGNNLSINYKSVGSTPHNGDVIDEIEVTNENGKIVRSIKFFITPYNRNTSLTKLDSVRVSAPGAEPRTYSFRYWGENSVPSIYTTAVDHWGFCNGSESSGQGKSTVPSLRIKTTLADVNGVGHRETVIVNYTGMNREPNHEWTKMGILNRVTDPQGIQTSFVYEGNAGAFRDNNKYGNEKDYLHPVGGLRIESIETLDPKTLKRMKKSYKYGLTRLEKADYEPVWGGGAIKHFVTERDYQSSVTRIAEDPYRLFWWNEYLTTYNSMPLSNISFNNGSAVMYNIVSEEVRDYIEGNTLKTNYYYNVNAHNFEDVLRWDNNDPIGSIHTFLMNQPASITDKLVRILPGHPQEQPDDFVNFYAATNQFSGAPVRTEYFRGDKLVSSTDYTYKGERVWDSNISIDLPVRLLMVDIELYMKKPSNLYGRPVFMIGNYSGAGVRTTSYLDIETYRALDKEITKEYHYVNGKVNVVTTEKKHTYNVSYSDPGVSLKPRYIETINSNGTKLVDNFDYRANYPGILSYHKHTENNNWKETRILFKPNSCLPEKVQSKTNLLPEFRDEVVYSAYDTNNNVAEIAGKDGTPIFFIWGYRNQFPIARIENASRQKILTALGYTDDVFGSWASAAVPASDTWTKINSLRVKLPDARVTTYEYKPLQGVVSITDPNNFITKFEYDNYSRLTDGYYLDTEARKVMLQKYIYNFGK